MRLITHLLLMLRGGQRVSAQAPIEVNGAGITHTDIALRAKLNTLQLGRDGFSAVAA